MGSAKNTVIARLTSDTVRVRVSAKPSHISHTFAKPTLSRNSTPQPIISITDSRINQWKMKATVFCGIISPNCEAHVASFKTFFKAKRRKVHTVTKNALKSLTKRSERTAVNMVHKIPYASEPKNTPSRASLLP